MSPPIQNEEEVKKEEDGESSRSSRSSSQSDERLPEPEELKIQQSERLEKPDATAGGIRAPNSRHLLRQHVHKYEEIPIGEGKNAPRRSSFSKQVPRMSEFGKSPRPADLVYQGDIELRGDQRVRVTLHPSLRL